MALIEAMMKELVKVSRQTEAWGEQMSRHLSYLEARTMMSGPLMHELVRAFGIKVAAMRPICDPGWLLRSCQDVATEAVRGLIRHYHQVENSVRDIVRKFYKVVRFCLEEAFRRHLSSWPAGGRQALMRGAYCSLMVSMKNQELSIMNPEELQHLSLFQSFTEANLVRMNQAVGSYNSSIQDCPSYEAAHEVEEIKHELVSLRSVPEADLWGNMAMSWNEADLVSAHAEGRVWVAEDNEDWQGGREGPKPFIWLPEPEETVMAVERFQVG